MKLTMIAAMTVAAVLTLAGNANAQILMSRHNFSGYAWSAGQVCLPCHTPHNANVAAGKLWNHDLTNATYTLHEGSGSASINFDRTSRLCLSCHDGTVALDSFGGQSGTSFVAGRALIGTDLTNDHPVGSDAQYPPSPVPSWWTTSMKDSAALPSALRLQNWVDESGVSRKVVGCSTCHNVHNKGFPHLLTMSNSASALCLGCHIK